MHLIYHISNVSPVFKRYIGLAANEQMMSRKASISETVYKQLAADLYGQGNQVTHFQTERLCGFSE